VIEKPEASALPVTVSYWKRQNEQLISHSD